MDSADFVLISKSLDKRREWFIHANVLSTRQRFGSISNADLILSDISTFKPALSPYEQTFLYSLHHRKFRLLLDTFSQLFEQRRTCHCVNFIRGMHHY
jgi:hypothetical protein